MNGRQICSLACATVLLVALFPATGFCDGPLQWDEAGVPLRQGAGIGAYTVAQDSQGQTLVVWCDLGNGSDDLFAQLISPAGVRQWGEGGVVVVAHPAEQVNPVAVAVDGGWIVFWIDHRNDCGSSIDPGWGDIYAQKLNSSGQRMWAANQHTGVPVDINTSAQVLHSEPLVAVADGNGGALVAWTSDGAGARFVLAQHVTGSGQLLWASPLSVADTMQMSYGMSGTGDANGNLFLGWYERRSNMYKLRTARITPDGVRAWGGSGVYVNTEDAMPSQRPQFCPDGAGGCYVGWVRNFWNDIFVQRLDSAGAALWNPGGIPACHSCLHPAGMSLALSRNGSVIDGCVLAWSDDRDWPTGTVINSQKVSPTGALQWDTAGVCIATGTCGSSSSTWRVEPKVISDQSGGLVCIWRDNMNGATLDGDLYACRLNSAGVSQWGTECTPVWVSPAAQTSAVSVPGPNGTFVFWIDIASGASSMRYQFLDRATGACILAQGGVSLTSGICGTAEHARSLMLSPGRYAAVWLDNRSWTCPELYYQIFDVNGQVLGPVNGSLLTPEHPSEGYFGQSSASLCTDGSGGFYAVFEQYAPTSLTHAAHVSATGSLLSPPEGIALSTTPPWNGDSECRAVPDGNGGCYVVWWAYNAMWLGKVRVQRIAASGETVWDEPVTLNETATVHQELSDVVVGAEGSCTVIYMVAPWDSGSLYGVNVQPDGEVAWTTHLSDSLTSDFVAVESDGDGGFVCAWETDNGTESFVRAQHVSSAGALLWPSPGTQVASGRNDVRNIVQDGHGNVFVGWTSSESAIYLQKLNSSGTLVWQVRRQVAAGAQPWVMRIMRDGGSGLFVCWDDHRGLRPHIYATHVDGEGQAVDESYWANGGGIVSTTWDAQEEPVLCPDGYGGMIVVYTDNKGIEEVGPEPPEIYAQRVNDGIVPSAAETRTETPREFALKQNYPNPFNPTTVIAFDLAREGRSTLEVFDLLGRRVMTLVDGVLAAGEHRVTLDAADLPSGTYIYRLQSADVTQSRKMLLLK
ncbi:MAG: T9SS type A sorting domain-containing protein [bacterium]|nr:T9SS type A sorting domain-containing protein [bacterium]